MTAHTITANGNDFYAALNRVGLAAETSRYSLPDLDKIAVFVKDDSLHVWATDRYRIHYDSLHIEQENAAETSLFYLPATLANDLKRFEWNKRGRGGDAVIQIKENQLTVSSSDSLNSLTLPLADVPESLHKSTLRILVDSLEAAGNGDLETVSNYSGINPRFLADIDKASRANPRDKAGGMVLEFVPNSARHILAKFIGTDSNFRALIMPIRTDVEDSGTRANAHAEIANSVRTAL